MKDSVIPNLIKKEEERQEKIINLIASENYTSKSVLEALGSPLTNKYGEGYPGARYYAGNEVTDEVEILCQKRALETFGLDESNWSVNVQPLSGSPANLAVYSALLSVGDVISGLELSQGGHLTHGYKGSMVSKFWESHPYFLDKKTECLNFDKIMRHMKKVKPSLIICGFTAYSRIIEWSEFRKIADEVGAYLLADISHIAGLIAGGEHPSPFQYVDVVTTTVHKTLRGPRSAMIFSRKDERDLHKKIDRTIMPGLQGGPHFNQIAGTAIALFEAQQPEFKKYIRDVIDNSTTMATTLSSLGWRIVSGGTDNHLFVMDVSKIGGTEASNRLEKEGIIVNKNTIPFDTRPPFNPSGLRIGSAAETTRGKTESDFKQIAYLIHNILSK